jgi:hypothetical protein
MVPLKYRPLREVAQPSESFSCQLLHPVRVNGAVTGSTVQCGNSREKMSTPPQNEKEGKLADPL